MYTIRAQNIDRSAIGVGTEGTKTVKRPSSCSSIMNAGTRASSISASAGFHD